MTGALNISDLMGEILAGWAAQQGGDPKPKAPAKKADQGAQKAMYVPGMGTTPIVNEAMSAYKAHPRSAFDFIFRPDATQPGNVGYLDPSGNFGNNSSQRGLSPTALMAQLTNPENKGRREGREGLLNIGQSLAEGYGEPDVASLMRWLPAASGMRYVNLSAGIPTQRLTQLSADDNSAGGMQNSYTGGLSLNVPWIQRERAGQRAFDPAEVARNWQGYSGVISGQPHPYFAGVSSQKQAIDRAQQLNQVMQEVGTDAIFHETSHAWNQNLAPWFTEQLGRSMESIIPGTNFRSSQPSFPSGMHPGTKENLAYLMSYLPSEKDPQTGTVSSYQQALPQHRGAELLSWLTSLARTAGHPYQHAAQIFEAEHPGKKFLDTDGKERAKYFERGFGEFSRRIKRTDVSGGTPRFELRQIMQTPKGEELVKFLLQRFAANAAQSDDLSAGVVRA